jgi:hypothetical protein
MSPARCDDGQRVRQIARERDDVLGRVTAVSCDPVFFKNLREQVTD